MKNFVVLFMIFFLYGVLVSARLNLENLGKGRSLAGLSEKIRAVNLGGWLVIEKWLQPSLFDRISVNQDLLDGTQIQLKSVTLNRYVAAEGGGGGKLVVDRKDASGWETLKLWRVSSTSFQLRVFNNKFVVAENGGGGEVLATRDTPSKWETFELERNGNRVHLKASNGQFLQATSTSQLTADYNGQPGWDDNAAVFLLSIVASLGGDFQLANGLGPAKANEVFKNHRDTFVTEDDFKFLADKKINAVRVPVGWWIAYDPNTPSPFVSGSLEALDRAFEWGKLYGLMVIVDLHAAPGSQNPWEHSANRDGISQWKEPENIAKTLDVIQFLTNRYKNHPALLGIELLNEPRAADVPLDVLTKFYRDGYDLVRKSTSSAYVLFCQRIGGDPQELVNIMNPSSGYTNVVLDIHLYNLFTDTFNNRNAQWHVDFVNRNRTEQIDRLNNAGGASIFVGEWTNVFDVSGATAADYTRFGDAQLSVYGRSSFGWAYWTLKTEAGYWSFRETVNEGLLRSNTNGNWP